MVLIGSANPMVGISTGLQASLKAAKGKSLSSRCTLVLTVTASRTLCAWPKYHFGGCVDSPSEPVAWVCCPLFIDAHSSGVPFCAGIDGLRGLSFGDIVCCSG